MDLAESSTAPFTEQSWVTDPGAHAALLAGLPVDLGELCRSIQGLVVHYVGGDTAVPPARLREIDTRRVEAMLARIVELDDQPLTIPRPLSSRLIGCCRDYAVLLCSALRQRGIPARVRFGFATYFHPTFHSDHVVTEYWNAEQESWVLVDAEMDAGFPGEQGLDFDPLDLPRDRFLVAGEAWQRCRRGELDPHRCGVNDEICGWGLVGRYVTLDHAALARTEILCWDGWGMADIPPDGTWNETEDAVLDRIALLSVAGQSENFGTAPYLPPPLDVRSYSAAGFYEFALPLGADNQSRA